MMDRTIKRPSGMFGLTVVLMGQAVSILALLSGYIFPSIRNMEDLLPDHDQLQTVGIG